MPLRPQSALKPRKTPVQARSAGTVAAMLQATLQVLLSVGKDGLTTTRVAARAGVSVGTLYQYFPNKRALLQAALRNHLEQLAVAVEDACRKHKGAGVEEMAVALVSAFLAVKLGDMRASVAFYAVSSDVDGASIAREVGARSQKAIAAMLESARPPLGRDACLVAAMLQGAMGGVSRMLLESSLPERRLQMSREELEFMVRSYLRAGLAPSA